MDIDFDHYYSDHNRKVDLYNYGSLGIAQWRDYAFPVEEKIAPELDAKFLQTPTYDICKIYQDNSILTMEEKRARSLQAIAEYKDRSAQIKQLIVR